MGDSIANIFKGKPNPGNVPISKGGVPVPQSPTTIQYDMGNQTRKVTQGTTNASAGEVINNRHDKLKDALVQGGVTMATGAIMNAMNKPKDTEKELIREKMRATAAAEEGAARMAAKKKKGGYGSTISPNSKVGGSSLASK